MDQQVSRGGDWIDDDEIVLDANESFDDDFDDVDDVDDIGSFVCRFSVLFLTLKWDKESESAETYSMKMKPWHSTRGPFS